MPYLLDGNNLIGQVRKTSRPTDEDRQALIAEVAERLRSTRARATLVFDGPGRGRSTLGSLAIVEAGDIGADARIVREVENSGAPREIIVVTADRELARRCRDAGAGVVSPSEFWKRFGISKGERESQAPSKIDVDEWAKYFEDEKNRL